MRIKKYSYNTELLTFEQGIFNLRLNTNINPTLQLPFNQTQPRSDITFMWI